MTWWQALVLGILQGLTEYLPVSSSGHLVLAQRLLGLPEQDGSTFEVFVHFGTLLSVSVFYRRDLLEMVRAVGRYLLAPRAWRSEFDRPGPFRLAALLALASVPAGLVGVFFEDRIDAVFARVDVVLWGLVATGIWLLATRLAPRGDGREDARSALVLGLAQAIAILPGVSRSGSTIGAGLLFRMRPAELARFSFLMSFPVILGATLLKTIDLFEAQASTAAFVPLAIGTAAAFASGLVAIRLLVAVLLANRLHWFGPYCLAAGAIGLFLL